MSTGETRNVKCQDVTRRSARCLVRQKEKLEKKIQSEQIAPSDLSGLSVSIINLLADKLTVAVGSVVAATGANHNTVKTARKDLSKRGFIAQKGKGRGVFYTLLS